MIVRRRRLTKEQREELWTRFGEGQSLPGISQSLTLSLGGVYGVVQARGGVRPPPATRASRTLTLADRAVIARGLAAGQPQVAIARSLGCAPSTISRELARNGGRTAQHRGYDATVADQRAWRAARRPKMCRLAQHAPLRRAVATKLHADWSPTQISAWLAMTYPQDGAMQLSPETIYRSLFVQARGVLRKELTAHLRRGHALRQSAGQRRRGRQGGKILGAISIAERPAESADRAVPGHWEGDLLAGADNSYIATLVERASRYVVLVKVNGKDSASVVGALIRRVRRLPQGLKASLTWDRGTELAQHKTFTIATDVAVYFCDPHAPWQRGSNENTNGLLRQYFPHGMKLTQFTQRQLDVIARKLNTRPRQTLGFHTPAATLANYVASTG